MNPPATDGIELELSQYDLYPPLLGAGPASVGISTGAPGREAFLFDFTLNGSAGEVAGISLQTGSQGGIILFSQDFLTRYDGTWPAQVEVRAWRDGVQAGSAILQLHDTRDMRPERVEVTLLPNPANVPVGEDLRVITRTTFFDANDVPLPDDEVFWEVQLPEGVQGVTVEGSRLRVSPLAQAGEVAVTVRERSGVEQVTALTLAPAMDIGLQSQPADLYPPCASSNADFLHISGAQPFDDEVSISVTLNGQGGQFTGMQLQSFGTYWVLLMDKNFIRHYPGAWPIEVRVLAVRNGQIVGAALSRLHDTRTMVCTRVDLQFNPGDQVQIPQEGETLVIAGPRFHDKDGISLPHGELPWSAQMVDPMEGVNMVKHLLYIGPGARPGAYRIAILGPNGLNRAKVLQLY